MTGRSTRELPRWVSHGSLVLTLLAVLALYTWDLAASGYANSFYSAAAQAGSTSWKAFFYGSLDAGNSITVDKTPGSLWLMALSVRIFGLSSWSILLPQALLGVGSAAILFASVRRALTGTLSESWHVTPTRAHIAGLVAALTMALTPAATLMFRFNNPDALMVFCYVLAAYCTVRATEAASRTWLAFAGIAIGIGFLAKMLQAFVLLPSLVLAYAIAAPTTWRKKIVDLLVAFAAMVVSFGWYIAIVELVPASWRPYIGGSQNNSILELTFGYNGLGRLTGNAVGVVGTTSSGGLWDGIGLTRMFLSESGEMVSFLIPAALVLGLTAVALIGRTAYNGLRQHAATGETGAFGALTLYGSWLVINGLVFSFMAGVYHDYYTVALAPAIAGTVAIAGTILGANRSSPLARAGFALAGFATAAWSVEMATLAHGIYLVVATAAGAALVIAAAVLLLARMFPPALSTIALGVALAGALAVPTSYSIQTVLTTHVGSTVTAGPVWTGMANTSSPAPRPGGGAQVGTGVLTDGTNVSSDLVAVLRSDAGSYTWVAATVGGQNTASYELATGYPVMAVGGFNGADPSPTLDAFKALVAQHRVHYYIPLTGIAAQGGGSASSNDIMSWVTSTFTAQTVGTITVYDLTRGN